MKKIQDWCFKLGSIFRNWWKKLKSNKKNQFCEHFLKSENIIWHPWALFNFLMIFEIMNIVLNLEHFINGIFWTRKKSLIWVSWTFFEVRKRYKKNKLGMPLLNFGPAKNARTWRSGASILKCRSPWAGLRTCGSSLPQSWALILEAMACIEGLGKF
jgi:hypothetical protein